ncbi:sporulation integral membrane protein YtvI [Hungatella sp.]|uniref:sporulation integral membrane protein YtvI n=1 Tax=Hungatella sp. TaxID=2613924 RepID=UPI002A80ECFE|nr:sporulation integral membrane protein YtvI [Hungatella sp.]
MKDQEHNEERIEQQKVFITKFFYWAVIVILTYCVIKYALPVLSPFLIAGIFACILNRPVCLLSEKMHTRRPFVCIPIVVVFFIIIGIAFGAAGTKIVEGMKAIADALPSFFTGTVFPFLEVAAGLLDGVVAVFRPEAEEVLSILMQSLGQGITSVSAFLLNSMASAAALVPSLFLKTVITIIATVFITMDFQKIKEFIVRRIPDRRLPIFKEARSFFGGTMVRCFVSYMAIFGITFIELALGFAFLGIPHGIFLAALIAVVDILPVLGTGTVLVPWGFITLFLGDYGLGIGILLLYLVITIVRNTIEPKLVGKQIGLHPVVTFAGMLLGLKYFGFLGMFGIPLFLAFLYRLKVKEII